MPIKIISQNVMCWERDVVGTYEIRRPLLNTVFHNYGADIIGMQEVTEDWEKYFDQDLKDFGKLLVYRSINNKEAVPIYWKKDRLDVIDSGHFWLSETPEKESVGWDAACIRITCWILFKDKETKKEFVFVNTHLDHVGKNARINGLQLIFDFIKEKFGENIPIVLTGDFNARPDSETVQKADSFLNNSRTIAKDTTNELTYHAYNREGEIPGIIDYIYLSQNIECEKFEVIKEFDGNKPQSDHYGILAEINI